MNFKTYEKIDHTEMRPYVRGETFYQGYPDYPHTSVSEELGREGHPQPGDMICRNPRNPRIEWLISEEDFKENYCPEKPNETPSNVVRYNGQTFLLTEKQFDKYYLMDKEQEGIITKDDFLSCLSVPD